MNRLSTYRTFGKSSYTPVKRVRIYSNRWYLCTFQNVERDPRFDYIGLGDGEYQELLSGDKARQARDAHLNHLNDIKEWTGEVWEVTWHNHNPQYVTSKDATNELIAQYRAEDARDFSKAYASVTKELSMSDAELLRIYGRCKDWPGHETQQLAKWRQFQSDNLEKCKAYYNAPIMVRKIR